MGVSTPKSSLQELPEKWKNTKKMATTVRQQVAPLQANEVALLRQRCTAFDTQQQQFRERFRKEAPFRCGSGRCSSSRVSASSALAADESLVPVLPSVCL